MKSEPTVRAIDVAGKIAADQKEIETLTQTLETTPLWMPAADLLNACRQGSRIVSDLLDRFEANLMVAIIGPSGSGKSTLLNALAGVDTLSETGPDRPTTEQIVVACRKETDAETLLDGFDRNDVRIKAVPAAPGLENLVLIDTPDTDSTQNDLHIPLVNRVIEMADVLICVFDAENPKRKDHTDPKTRRKPGCSTHW
nr:50S ribosome-binding GTPase [Deltaproteobacteria bacterium]